MRPSGRETSKASSGSSIPQKIIDVVVPVGVSNEICKATYETGLEEAFSVPLLEGNGETRVPGIQQADFPPMTPASNLWILLSDGVSSTPRGNIMPAMSILPVGAAAAAAGGGGGFGDGAASAGCRVA